ncbi:hypothetical protein CCO03_00480 [Comamonas serinivorans]|uniref:GNAT family N-acetyltransferase n=1 Tax=Comamonas serinivorans TaxID=1082851 RepID=A0A1Y0EIE0_9BURK|nr:hypothetical protein [Comamonas serinivorans]ARU03364.1 hypothetical protein CCO03_00480 [Comamonas serinivorans]
MAHDPAAGGPALDLRHVDNDAELQASFAVMQALRPHWQDAARYREQFARQRTQGYRLQHTLLHGRSVVVDDRVVTASARGLRVGERLVQAVRQQARQLQAHHLVLDTGLHMALAQRFDVRQGLLARGLHFVEPL